MVARISEQATAEDLDERSSRVHDISAVMTIEGDFTIGCGGVAGESGNGDDTIKLPCTGGLKQDVDYYRISGRGNDDTKCKLTDANDANDHTNAFLGMKIDQKELTDFYKSQITDNDDSATMENARGILHIFRKKRKQGTKRKFKSARELNQCITRYPRHLETTWDVEAVEQDSGDIKDNLYSRNGKYSRRKGFLNGEEFWDYFEEIFNTKHAWLEKYTGCGGVEKYVRQKKNRKIEKAHKQIKHKHCTDVSNNAGRKQLFMHHRIAKRAELKEQGGHYLPEKPPKGKKVDLNRKDCKNNVTMRKERVKPRHAPSQPEAKDFTNPHALEAGFVPDDLDADIVTLLFELQERDLSPEDYDVLLRLDDRVEVKTVSDEQVQIQP